MGNNEPRDTSQEQLNVTAKSAGAMAVMREVSEERSGTMDPEQGLGKLGQWDTDPRT